MRAQAIIAGLFLSLAVIAQQPPLPHAGENEVLALAAADLRTLPREEQIFQRYIWVVDAERESMQIDTLALNYISRSPVVVKLLPLGKDKLMVLRVDLRAFAPREADLNDLVRVWEEFRFDPRFSLLITKDSLKFATGIELPQPSKKTVKKTVVKQVPRVDLNNRPIYGTSGQIFDAKEVVVEEVVPVNVLDADTNVLRVVSEHVNKDNVAFLIQATQSQAPVVNDNYFRTRTLTTIQGKGVFKTVYGGLYYQLSGIKKGFKKGTDEDNLFAALGIGNIEQGIDAKKVFDAIRGDQRVALFRSNVTGKPRRIDMLRSLTGRDSQGLVSVTHDLRDDDIDVGTHPIMNLLDFKDAAREVIFERANGLHGFALFNGAGALQDEVPPEIAADNTIPIPYGARLQPAIGCIRCHAKDGGWKPASNDVKKLLSGYVDVFSDQTEKHKSPSDVVNRLAGLYAGDLELKLLPRGRDDLAGSVLKTTGPWQRSKDQTDVVKLSGDRIADAFRAYNYETVDARKALLDFGIDVPAADAPAALKKLVPPVNVVIDGVIPEDPRIAALAMGLAIPRTDYDLIYSFLATRIQRAKK